MGSRKIKKEKYVVMIISNNTLSRERLIRKITPMNFTVALKTVLDEYELSVGIIDDEFHIDKRTVQRYYYGECEPTRITLIQLLIEIGCYYEVSCLLYFKAGFSFRLADMLYIQFLRAEGKYDIPTCNAEISDYNSRASKTAELKLFRQREKI